ncbi:MAG: hypothetical protein ACKO6Q_07520 [Bacteroidota bacterium]
MFRLLNYCTWLLLLFSYFQSNVLLHAQPPADFKGGFFTRVSRQNNLLFGGVPNSVFLERSLYGTDSVRIESGDALLTISRDSGNWYTITPKLYRPVRHLSDVYDSLLDVSRDDLSMFLDTCFQQQVKRLENFVFTERLDRYETFFTISHLKKKDNKYVIQSKSYVPVQVIPATYDVFALYGGKQSGEQFSKEEFFANTSLTTFVHFKEDEQYLAPSVSETYEVVSFTISWDTKEGDVLVVNGIGDKLTSMMKSQLKSSLTDESFVVFENIKVKSKLTGRIQKAPSFFFYLKK